MIYESCVAYSSEEEELEDELELEEEGSSGESSRLLTSRNSVMGGSNIGRGEASTVGR